MIDKIISSKYLFMLSLVEKGGPKTNKNRCLYKDSGCINLLTL